MLRTIIETSLRHRFLIVAAALALLIVAVTKMDDTPTDMLPEFLPPIVEIQTEALGLSAAEVEQLITVPLEADLLNGVAWLDTIRSESIPSLSSVELQFLPGTDIMAARHMVQEKLTQAHGLPNVSKPPVMLQPLSSTSRVLKVGLSSEELSLIQLSVLARWNIRPRLMGVPGVANVSIWGQRKRQLQVLVDPERIRSEGVSLLDVVTATGNALWVSPLSFLEASSPGTGGFIDTPNQRLGVRHVLPIVSPEGLADVVIAGSDKRLGDVTEVVESHQPLIGDAIVGEKAGVMLVVEKFPWANTLDVTRDVEKALEELKHGLTGIKIDTRIFRPASFIERAVGNIQKAMIAAGVLVLLGLFLFCNELRTTLIGAAAIASSLLLAWFVFFLGGVTMDALVFTGLMIALGAIVDDAIVSTRSIRQRLARERPDGVGTWEVITGASVKMRGTLMFATLMLLLLVVPFFSLAGVKGTFLSTVGVSYSVAVIASMVVAMTLIPALSLLLLPKDPAPVSSPPLSRALLGYYDKVTSGFAGAKPLAYGIAAAGLVVMLVAQPMVYNKPLVPEFRETDLLIHWNAKPGTSQPEMSRITIQVTNELRAIPGVRNVGAHVGRAITSDQVVGISASELWVSIDDEADYDATLAAIEAVVGSYPGMEQDVTTYPLERIEEVMGTEEDKVVVRLYGQETDVLSTEGQKVKDLLADIEGVTEIEVTHPPVEPTIEIRVDLERAKKSGIKPGDVRRAAATLLSGLEVGSLFEEKKVFDVIVWGTPGTRDSITDIREMLLQAPDGTYVKLGEVADVEVKSHPTVLRREGVARYLDVEIEVFGRSQGEVAREVSEKLAGHTFPLEYRAMVLGDIAERAAAHRYEYSVLLVALIGIYLLLQAAFRSWKLATMVFLTVPVAPLGGILLVLFTGAEFTLGSFIGVVTVFGLALRGATLLVVHYQRLEYTEGVAFGPDLVIRGTRERAEPILASIIVTALAVLPFVYYMGNAGLEVIGPMAGVILAGLVTTLVFALLVVPTLYLAFGAGAASAEDFENLQEGPVHE